MILGIQIWRAYLCLYFKFEVLFRWFFKFGLVKFDLGIQNFS